MLAVGGTADAQDGADAQSAQRLFDQFADPGSEFRTKPFMVWNTEITPHRIDRILSEYKEQGCGGVFILSFVIQFFCLFVVLKQRTV